MTRLQLLVRGLEVGAPTPVCRGGRDIQVTVLFLGQLWHASALGQAVGGLHATGIGLSEKKSLELPELGKNSSLQI